MKLPRLSIATALILGSVVLAGLAWTQTPPDQTAETPAPPPVSMSALVDQMVARFPRLEADVVEVQGTTLTLSAGQLQGVRQGLTLSVYREGREIRHPRTGELLGRTEESVGRATVTRVLENLSFATLEGDEARVNDRARVGTGKIKLTLLPLRGGVKENLAEAVTHELYEGLVGSERFEVTLGEQIGVWLAQKGIGPAELLQGKGLDEVASRFKTEHLLVVAFSMVDRKPFMDIRLFTAPRPEPLLSTAFFVPSSIKARAPGQFSSSDRPRTTPERKPRSFLSRLLSGETESGAYSSAESSIPLREVARFGFPVLAMDMAIPAEGVPRLTISNGARVFLYRVVNRTLEAEWTYAGRHIGRVVALSLVDLDADGALEVAVTRYDPILGLHSLILKTKDGRPTVMVDNIGSFLVGVDDTGAGIKQALWAQEPSEKTLFAKGRVARVTVKDRRLVALGRVAVPDDFRATGVTTSNLMGPAARALVYIGEDKRLRVSVANEERWRSSSGVGGNGYLKVELARNLPDAGVSTFYSMEPAPLSVDLDADGTEEILVPQNQLPGMLAVIFRGPAGIHFQQVPSGFEGMVTGLGAVRGVDGEPPTLLICVVRFKGILSPNSGESQIIMTAAQE
jgi:hypothetical protein